MTYVKHVSRWFSLAIFHGSSSVLQAYIAPGFSRLHISWALLIVSCLELVNLGCIFSLTHSFALPCFHNAIHDRHINNQDHCTEQVSVYSWAQLNAQRLHARNKKTRIQSFRFKNVRERASLPFFFNWLDFDFLIERTFIWFNVRLNVCLPASLPALTLAL